MRKLVLGLMTMVALINAPVGAAAGSATFLAPAEGATLYWDYAAASIQWTEVDATHAYAVTFASTNGSGTYCSWAAGVLVNGDTKPCGLSLFELGPWTVSAVDTTDATTLAQVSFTVVCPPGYVQTPEGWADDPCKPQLYPVSASASPLKFYPLVRDGYRDATQFAFEFNRAASVRVYVRNSSGRVIRRVSLGDVASGSWGWNGRNNAGNKVPTGYYRIRAVATDGFLKKRTNIVRVQVATRWITKSATKRRWGNEVSSKSTSGSCYITRDSYYGIAMLDCWGGNYAKVTYGFSIPSTTFKISSSVRGELALSDICCYGTVSKGGYRASSKRFVAWAKVTGWRAFDVYSARITYSYKVRI
jgi:FlgD Ig-like domain